MLERRHHDKVGGSTFLLGFGIEEIDKIMVDRICFHLIKRSFPKFPEMMECGKLVNDQISKLPDEILSSILSLLSMREAAKTSILARRWKDIWKSSMNLDFEMMKNKCGDSYCAYELSGLQREWCKFVSWVDQILPIHLSSRIDTFRVRHCLGKEHACHIDQWIRFALDKKVNNLDLHFSKLDIDLPDYEPYSLPCWMFLEGRDYSLKHLSLTYCKLPVFTKFGSFNFKSLASLTLRDVGLSEGHLEMFLSGCVNLEWLSLTHCLCPHSLQVEGPFLKYLSISHCFYLMEIKISATNLLSFELKGSTPQFSFKNPPRKLLRSGFWSYSWDCIKCTLGKIASDFPSLETLLLFSSPETVESIFLKQLPTFTKLKILELTIITCKLESLLPFTQLLEASPFLIKFKLHLQLSKDLDKPIEVTRKISKFPHKHLKEAKIFGFYGHHVELEFAIYLLNNAIILERMELNTAKSINIGDGEFIMASGRKTKIRKKRIYKLLQKEAPSTCTARLLIR